MAPAAGIVEVIVDSFPSECRQSFSSAQSRPLRMQPSPHFCKRLRARPRLLGSLVIGASLCLGASIAAYFIVPQVVINQRLKAADVNIGECILEIGPNAAATISPTVGFSVSRSILQLPLVNFKARVDPFTANIYFVANSTNMLLGTFELESGLDIDSNEDLNLTFTGAMTLTDPDELAKAVNLFIKEPNVTLTVSGTLNVHAKVWNWMPVALFGINIEKSITVPSFNDFMDKNVALDQLISAEGSPGVINITASAKLFNPSPVTMIVHDAFQLGVSYFWNGDIYDMGTLFVRPPLTILPGANLPIASVSVNKTSENERAIQGFITEYIGPQDGFSPAGGDLKPLLVRMSDDGPLTSSSLLIREATHGLSLPVDFRPEPIYFLSAITADIVALSSPMPPFYSCVVNLRVKNPLPQVVEVKKISVIAYHLNRTGPVLYHYKHEIKQPKFNPAKYVLNGMENITLDFKLNVLEEVNWGFLLSPKEIAQLIAEAASMKITVGVSLNLTITINHGYEQVVHYENNALSGVLCFHPLAPKDICGGLPPNPHSGRLIV